MSTTATASSAGTKKDKKAPLDKTKLLAKVMQKVTSGCSHFDSKVSKENERVERYNNLELPKKQKEGNSSYVSSDVYDSVESMKAQLLETFGGQYKIVRATAYGKDDTTAAALATNYVDKVIFHINHNNGFFILQDVLDTSLKARNAVAEVYWEDRKVYDEHTFQRMSLTDVQGLTSQPDVEVEADLVEDQLAVYTEPQYKGTWRRVIDKGRCVINVLAPEEFWVEKRVKRRQDGARGTRCVKTRQELIDDGYDKKLVMDANAAEATQLQFAQEAQARNEQTDEGVMPDPEAQKELEEILVYETYMDLVLDGRKALYHICHTDNVMFSMDEVAEDRFIEFAPLRRAHSWYGHNFAAKSIPTQNARTVLARGVLDHTAHTMNPRWKVLNGTLQSPRELLDPRQGGVVNIKNKDGVAPLEYPQLNQFVLPVLEMLKTDKEERTGISSLSQGLNKDAVSTQNSQGLVENLVNLSQVRQKIVARNFAIFILQLWQKVYKCVVENDRRMREEPINGNLVQMKPAEWKLEREFELSLHLGYGEQDKLAGKKQGAYQAIASDPVLGPGFDYSRRRAKAAEILDDSGVSKNVDEWLAEEPPQPPPSPEMLKVQNDKTKADAALLTAQSHEAKVAKDTELGMLKHQLQEMQAKLAMLMQSRDADRKDLDVTNRVNVSQREIAIAEAAPVDQGKENVIVSPNG